MAERLLGGAQHALAQDPAMGVHQRERRVVADRADVAEVIGEPLHFGHQRAQPVGSRRNRDAERRLGGAREGDLIGDRAVAADAARQLGAARQIGARHQRVDALVDVAEPLLQPRDGLAGGVKAEMAGFDDAGVHRPDGNLVQARAFRGEKRVRRGRGRRRLAGPEGMADRPAAVIEPRPLHRARRPRVRPQRSAERAFEADRGRMRRPDRGELAVDAWVGEPLQIGAPRRRQRHARLGPVAPQADEPAPLPPRAAPSPRARRPSAISCRRRHAGFS